MSESRWRLLTLITVFTLGGAAYGFKLQHERIQVRTTALLPMLSLPPCTHTRHTIATQLIASRPQVYKDDLDARV